jgi:hypothetical protein
MRTRRLRCARREKLTSGRGQQGRRDGRAWRAWCVARARACLTGRPARGDRAPRAPPRGMIHCLCSCRSVSMRLCCRGVKPFMHLSSAGGERRGGGGRGGRTVSGGAPTCMRAVQASPHSDVPCARATDRRPRPLATRRAPAPASAPGSSWRRQRPRAAASGGLGPSARNRPREVSTPHHTHCNPCSSWRGWWREERKGKGRGEGSSRAGAARRTRPLPRSRSGAAARQRAARGGCRGARHCRSRGEAWAPSFFGGPWAPPAVSLC